MPHTVWKHKTIRVDEKGEKVNCNPASYLTDDAYIEAVLKSKPHMTGTKPTERLEDWAEVRVPGQYEGNRNEKVSLQPSEKLRS